MENLTLDKITLNLRSMAAEFFTALDECHRTGIDMPVMSQVFRDSFPHFQPAMVDGDTHLPHEAAVRQWLRLSWVRILELLDPNKWRLNAKGRYPKRNATDIARCVAAYTRYLTVRGERSKLWTGSELALRYQTPQAILDDFTQYTGIKTDSWYKKASASMDLAQLFGARVAELGKIPDAGPWNQKVREGEELVFEVERRAWEIFEYNRQNSGRGNVQTKQVQLVPFSASRQTNRPIDDASFLQILPPKSFSLVWAQPIAAEDDPMDFDADDEFIEPFVIVRPVMRNLGGSTTRSKPETASPDHENEAEDKQAQLNKRLIMLFRRRIKLEPFPFYETILKQDIVDDIINGSTKLLLAGQPGSGRTTVAVLVAAQLCNDPDGHRSAIILDFRGSKNKLHLRVNDVPHMIYSALTAHEQNDLNEFAIDDICTAISELIDAGLVLPIFDHIEWLSDNNKTVLVENLTRLSRFVGIVHQDDSHLFIRTGASEVEMPVLSLHEIADYYVRKSEGMSGDAVPSAMQMLNRLPGEDRSWRKAVCAYSQREKIYEPDNIILDVYLEDAVRSAGLVGFYETPQRTARLKRFAGRLAVSLGKDGRTMTASFDKADMDRWPELYGLTDKTEDSLRELRLCGWLRCEEDGWRFSNTEIAAYCAAPIWLQEFDTRKDNGLLLGQNWVPVIAAATELIKQADSEKLAKMDKKSIQRLNRMADLLVKFLKGKDDDLLVRLSLKLKQDLIDGVAFGLSTRGAAGQYLMTQVDKMIEQDSSDAARLEYLNHQLQSLDQNAWLQVIGPHKQRADKQLTSHFSTMDKAYVSRVIRVLDHPEAELFYRWQVTELNKLSPPGISALGGIPAADIALRNICIYALSHLQNKEVRNTVGGLFSVTRHWQEEIVARLMTHPSVEAFDFGMQLALSSGSHVSWKPDNTISLVEEYGGAVSVARAAGRLNTLINGDFAKWTSEAELLYRLCSLSDAHRIQDVIAKATPYRPER